MKKITNIYSIILFLISIFLCSCHNPLASKAIEAPIGYRPGDPISNAVVNIAPVASADSLSTNKNIAASSTLIAVDANSDVLLFSIVASPAHGTVVITNTATGAYTYTPDNNFSGSDSFTFVANDGTVDSNTATISITINNTATAPVAVNITPASFNEDTESGFITLNYSDVDNDLATSCALSSLNGVTVTTACACDGSGVCKVKVTGTANKNGAASFSYTVVANGETSNTASASFTITPVNDDPTLTRNNTLTLKAATTATITSSGYLAVADVDNTAAQSTFTIGTAPTHGLLKKSGTNLIATNTFTQDDLDNNRITYVHTTSTDTALDSFTFTVSDGAGGSIALTTFNIVPVVAPQALTRVLPVSTPGNSTSVTIKAENGSVLSGRVVKFYTDSSCVGTQFGSDATTNGSNEASTTAVVGAEAAYLFYATVTVNGIISECSPVAASYLLDTTASVAPAIAFNSPSSSPGNNSTPTFNITLTGGGNFETTDTIAIYNQAACAGSSVGSATSVSTAIASVTVSAQAEGTTTYSAKITDEAGNTTCSSAHATVGLRSIDYLYDGTPPVVPVIIMAAGSANPDTSTTPIFAITLTGAINYTSGDVITLYEGGNNTCNGTTRGTSTISGGATSSVNITTNSALSSFGAVNYFAKVTDLAGNSTCTSSGVSYTYRPTPPANITRTTPTSTPGNNTTPVITVDSGGVVDGSTVTLFSNSSCTTALSAVTAATGTSVAITTNTLSEGAYLFYANVTINSTTSACSIVAAAYVLDTTAPAVPGITLNSPSSSPGNNATPSFNITLLGGGNFSITDTMTIYNAANCGGSSVGSISGVSTGTASVAASAQAEGTTTYSAKVTDEAGNSTCSSAHTTIGARAIDYLYDGTNPTITGLSDDATPTASKTWTWGCSETCTYRYAIDTSLSWTATGAFDATVTTTKSTGSGTFYLHVQAQDTAGNLSTVTTVSVIINHPPTLTMPSNQLFPIGGANPPLIQANSSVYTFTTTIADSDGDTVTSACAVESVGLGSTDTGYVATGTNCTSLSSYSITNGILMPGTASFSAGVLTWDPTVNYHGIYKFTVTANDGTVSTSGSFYATVRENFLSTNLLGGLDALYSDDTTGLSGVASVPRLETASNNDFASWFDLMGFNAGSLASFVTSTPWLGDGSYNSPLALSFLAVHGDLLTIPNALSGATKVLATG